MEYGKAFSFITEDPNWVGKLAIAALLLLLSGIIPVLPLLPLLGFALELTRNVARGAPRPLPQWEGIEEKLRQGFSVFIIGLAYRAPLVLFSICVAALAVATTLGIGISAGAARNGAGTGGADGFAALIPLLVICAVCVGLVYGMFAALMSSAGTVAFLQSGKLSDAFRLRAIWALAQRYLGDFIMLWLALLVAGVVAALLGIITCGLGMLVIAPWLMLAEAHLLGQIARKAFPPLADALAPVAAQ